MEKIVFALHSTLQKLTQVKLSSNMNLYSCSIDQDQWVEAELTQPGKH